MQTRVPNDLWLLTEDPAQIHQVLLNLCVKARDAMPQGSSLAGRVSTRFITRVAVPALMIGSISKRWSEEIGAQRDAPPDGLPELCRRYIQRYITASFP